MLHPQLEGGPPTLCIAGDDDASKSVVSELAEQLGWGVADCGGIEAARLTEPAAMLWIERAIRTGDRSHAMKWLGI